MTLWAIQITPWASRRPRPWLNANTVSSTRRGAWEKLREGGTPFWHKEIKKRQRKGLLRAVKVTIQLKETS